MHVVHKLRQPLFYAAIDRQACHLVGYNSLMEDLPCMQLNCMTASQLDLLLTLQIIFVVIRHIAK